MGAYLPKPKTEKICVQGKNARMSYAATGMQGWRINMEDAHISKLDFIENLCLFGIFDGHGGAEVAKFVEKNFITELTKNNNFQKKNYEQSLIETFMKMDELLLSPNGKKELQQIKKQVDPNGDEDSQAGCTANVCLLTQNKIIVANAGDSRCVISVKGKAVEMSIDHKPDDEGEKNRITKAGGDVWEGRVNGNLNLSRAIGDLEYKADSNLKADEQLIIAKPDVKTYNITNDVEFIVLGCDGIWECKTNQQIIDFISKKMKDPKENLKTITEKFLDENLAKDQSQLVGLDNMSIIIIKLGN